MRKFLTLAVLPFLMSAPIVPQADQLQEDYEFYISKAKESYEKENYEEAILHLKQAEEKVSSEKEFAGVYNSLGWVYFRKGDIESARIYLKYALDRASEHNLAEQAKKISNNLGKLEYSSNNPDEAKLYFESEWSKNSKTSNDYLKLLKEQGKTKLVEDLIKQGIAYRENEQFAEAIEQYDMALEIFPEDERVLEYKGYALYRMESFEESVEFLKKANEAAPTRITVVLNLMKVYCALDEAATVEEVEFQNKDLLSENEELVNSDGELEKACSKIMKAHRAAKEEDSEAAEEEEDDEAAEEADDEAAEEEEDDEAAEEAE